MSERYVQLALFEYKQQCFMVGTKVCVQVWCCAWNGTVIFLSIQYF